MAASRTLTARQQEVLEFIQERYRIAGHEPTYREIARRLGVTVRAAAQHVQALEQKKTLSRHRGILLAPAFRPARGPLVAFESGAQEALDVDGLLAGLREPGLVAARAVESQPEFSVQSGDLLVARPMAAGAPAGAGALLLVGRGDRPRVQPATARPGAGDQVLGQIVLVLRTLPR